MSALNVAGILTSLAVIALSVTLLMLSNRRERRAGACPGGRSER